MWPVGQEVMKAGVFFFFKRPVTKRGAPEALNKKTMKPSFSSQEKSRPSAETCWFS